MSRRRIAMRRIREILRLRYELNLGQCDIAFRLGMSSSTVHDHILRASVAGITWPIQEDMDDEQLDALLFRKQGKAVSNGRVVPDWHVVNKELKRKSVTLKLLWIEYYHSHAYADPVCSFGVMMSICNHILKWIQLGRRTFCHSAHAVPVVII